MQLKNSINDASLYNFIKKTPASLQDGYNELVSTIKEFHPEYLQIVEAFPLQQKFKKFEKWFDELILREEFRETRVIIIIPFITSDGEIILNLNLSCWWDQHDSDWAAADECILEFYDHLYEGIEKISMEKKPIGNYFSIAFAALFVNWYAHIKGNTLLSSADQQEIYLALSNFGETVTFAQLTDKGVLFI